MPGEAHDADLAGVEPPEQRDPGRGHHNPAAEAALALNNTERIAPPNAFSARNSIIRRFFSVRASIQAVSASR